MAYIKTMDLSPEARDARRARHRRENERRTAGRREYDRKRYEERAERGLCRACGARLRPLVVKGVLCPLCWEEGRERWEERRVASPLQAAGGGLRRGGGGRIGAVARISVACDREVAAALVELRRVAERDLPPGAARLTLSRLVRETIRRDWGQPGVWCPPRAGRRVNAPDLAFSVSVDAETLAIIERNALRTFGGIRSVTVRAMLAASARRDRDSTLRLVTGATAGRRILG